MSLTQQARKGSVAQVLPPTGREPLDPPPLPQDVMTRFPSLREWQQRHDLWWENIKQKQRETEDALETLRKKVNG